VQLMNGIHDTHLLPGKYRTEPNWIVDQGIRVYEPPSHIDVPILMREFSEWLMAEKQEEPVISAGIAHLHLIAIHPFVDGNGRTARLLATLLLQKSGYGFRKLLSLDAYYQRNRDKYIDALRSSLGKKYTPEYECTKWLDFFTRSIVLQAGTLEEKLTDWRIEVEKVHETWKKTGLNDRQIDGLIYANRLGYLTRKHYAEITNVSLITASRDIAAMVKIGLLKPEGKARNLKYTLIVKKTEDK
jgi:Fic family protein